jgi:hypothetical protein
MPTLSEPEQHSACDTLVLGCHMPLKVLIKASPPPPPFFIKKELPKSRTTTLLKLLHQHHALYYYCLYLNKLKKGGSMGLVEDQQKAPLEDRQAPLEDRQAPRAVPVRHLL